MRSLAIMFADSREADNNHTEPLDNDPTMNLLAIPPERPRSGIARSEKIVPLRSCSIAAMHMRLQHFLAIYSLVPEQRA